MMGRKGEGRLYILHNNDTEFTFKSNVMPYSSSMLNNLWTLICPVGKPTILLSPVDAEIEKFIHENLNFFEKVTFFSPVHFMQTAHDAVTTSATHTPFQGAPFTMRAE